MPVTSTDKLLHTALRMTQRFAIIGSRRWGGPKTIYVWNRIPFYKQMWEAAASAPLAYLVSTYDTYNPADDLQPTLAVLTTLLGDARRMDREERSTRNRDASVAAARPNAL